MEKLAQARVTDLKLSKVEELTWRFEDEDYAPSEKDWPHLFKLASYVQNMFRHSSTVMSAGASPPSKKGYTSPRQTKSFPILLKWTGGISLGKETTLFVAPDDSILTLKSNLCQQEPSLRLESIRLAIGSAPIGFNAFRGPYDPSIDSALSVAELGLTAGMELSLTTTATTTCSLNA